MSSGPEWEHVESPFLDQLVSMGWKLTTGNLDHPSVTGRESFREVLLLDDLRRALVEALRKVVDEARQGRQADDTGLDPETQAPFLDVLKREVKGDAAVADAELAQLCEVTVELVEHIQQEVRLVGFWRNAHAQQVLRNWNVQFLDDHDEIVPFEHQEAVADRLVELAKANHHKLIR